MRAKGLKITKVHCWLKGNYMITYRDKGMVTLSLKILCKSHIEPLNEKKGQDIIAYAFHLLY